MKRHIIAGLGVVAALALAAAPAAAKPADPPTRPFTGSAITYDSMGGTEDCTLPQAMWSFGGEGPGIFTQLGRVHFEIEHCSWSTGPTTGAFDEGKIVITAANGDQLFMDEEGSFELVMGPAGPVSSLVDLTWEVTGGTGRFTGATGEGTANPIGDLVAGTTSATFTGWLSYAASGASLK